MSITAETAKHMPMILQYCAVEQKLVSQLRRNNSEDPAIFDDLVDSGLLNLTDALQSKKYCANLQKLVILFAC